MTTTLTTPALSTRTGNRRLSRNQQFLRGSVPNRRDQYAAEVLRIATRLASRYTHGEADRDEVVGRVLEHFTRGANRYMAAYPTPAQYVNGTIWTRYQDFLRAERRQGFLGDVVVLTDGTKVTSNRRLGLTIKTKEGEIVDRVIIDHTDAYASAGTRIDIERAAKSVTPKFRQAVQAVVVDGERAVAVARREGVAHTTIANRVVQGKKELLAHLGDDYELGTA
jgi:DNA-directed RNA polymerase specialized sigma24 family protein